MTIREAAQAEAPVAQGLGEVVGQALDQAAGQTPETPETPTTRRLSWDWLRRDTGAGDLADYASHPLHVFAADDQDGLRITRGMAGLLGGGRWALGDVALGVLGMARRAWDRAAAARGGAPHA